MILCLAAKINILYGMLQLAKKPVIMERWEAQELKYFFSATFLPA